LWGESQEMKYFVFVFDNYYPLGGFEDCKGVFDSEDDALCYLIENHPRLNDDNIEIVVLENNEPKDLYFTFTVNERDQARFVLGDSEKKIIRLMGVVFPFRCRLGFTDDISDYKLDLFEAEKCKS
jgi:hypothetical protein